MVAPILIFLTLLQKCRLTKPLTKLPLRVLFVLLTALFLAAPTSAQPPVLTPLGDRKKIKQIFKSTLKDALTKGTLPVKEFTKPKLKKLPTQAFETADKYQIYRGVQYTEVAGQKLRADIYLPKLKGPLPAILVVHGGAWAAGTRKQLEWMARSFANSGYTVVAISYRLAPRFKFPAQIEDCRAALAWMRKNSKKYKINPDRIGGYGYSAGAHLVTLLGVSAAILDPVAKNPVAKNLVAKNSTHKKLASNQPPAKTSAVLTLAAKALTKTPGKISSLASAPSLALQAVVAGGTPCDFRAIPENQRLLKYWLGGTRAEKPNLYRIASPAAFVSAAAPPMFFFHGEKDWLVPSSGAQAMVQALTKAGASAQFHLVPGAMHRGACYDEKSLEMATAFFQKNLKDKK